MTVKTVDTKGNVYHQSASGVVAVHNKNYLDYSINTIFGERTINQVIHSHPRLELSIIKKGKGCYHIGEQIYDIEPGDIFVINNIEPHGIALKEGEFVTNMVLHFEPRFVWGDYQGFDARYLKIFFERNASFSHKLDNNNLATKQMRQLFYEIESEFDEKAPEYELMIKVKVLNILALLLRHYGYVKSEQGEAINGPYAHVSELKIINKVTEYIDGHFDEEIKLQNLADVAHMNPTYFSTFFKKYNGMTPTDYIIRRRITRAIEFLNATDKTVLEISGLCGFNNATNFNKMFKKITGLTPSGYRKSGGSKESLT